jgi:hypothetical protein
MSDKDRGVTATIKYDKGYDAPWLVFSGAVDTVFDDIVAAFGLDAEDVSELTLNELLVRLCRRHPRRSPAGPAGAQGCRRRLRPGRGQGSRAGQVAEGAAARAGRGYHRGS